MSRFGVGDAPPLRGAGFIGNPFRALSETEWQEISLVPDTVRTILEREDDAHLQVLGAAGHGKSSVLRAMMREARQRRISAVYEYIPNGADRFLTDVPRGCWFCLDEVQRLSTPERTRLLGVSQKRDLRLFLGSHEDLGALFERVGVRLATVTLDIPDAVHFDAVLRNRLAYFALPDKPCATLSEDTFVFLRERFGSNLRQTERFLFDFFQLSVRTPKPITAKQLSRESESLP
ncbi:MAG: hypothetical protein H8F28_04575 [Fibrella sp.]|nr:hypothetical protein [Armatimonadota bacterium]